jgi:hypothetical protein
MQGLGGQDENGREEMPLAHFPYKTKNASSSNLGVSEIPKKIALLSTKRKISTV